MRKSYNIQYKSKGSHFVRCEYCTYNIFGHFPFTPKKSNFFYGEYRNLNRLKNSFELYLICWKGRSGKIISYRQRFTLDFPVMHEQQVHIFFQNILCHSHLCTEQLINISPQERAEISAVRCTNLNGIVVATWLNLYTIYEYMNNTMHGHWLTLYSIQVCFWAAEANLTLLLYVSIFIHA